jgi:aspartate-semialdehyde dehydrogenase
MKEYNVAVVGASGAVGRQMVKCLEERNFPVRNLKLLATEKSAGSTIEFKGEKHIIEKTTPEAFAGIEIALFSAGGSASLAWAPEAVKKGAVVIDNSSAFRMDKDVPLVVPEVNPQDIHWHKGIIANPNCSTIQMVVALKPLHDFARIKRIVVSTYQAVSGSGAKAMNELMQQVKDYLDGKNLVSKVYPHAIAFNALPHIDVFLEDGYTKEEMKMVNETKKIMGDDSIKVSATTVRIPVFNAHSESINIETKQELSVTKAKELLHVAPGVILMDNPEQLVYPMPIIAAGRDEVFVGRIRKDETVANGLNLWVVADNLRKGAATNAVQIAELLVKN